MRTTDFDYFLPPELVAQYPSPNRSSSRLFRVDRSHRSCSADVFSNFPNALVPGDVVVVNNSRVIPARLFGRKAAGAGAIEVLLLESAAEGGWWTLLRPGKRVRPGTLIVFEPSNPTAVEPQDEPLGHGSGAPGWIAPSQPVHANPPSPWPPPAPLRPLEARVVEKRDDGRCRLEFATGSDVLAYANRHGLMPLPPYIRRNAPDPEDWHRYQTIYARHPGSVAAPTAGLHFTPELLHRVRAQGVEIVEVTLHVGIGTFSPVKSDTLPEHVMHTERFEVPEDTALAVERTRARGGRVVAVGTTTLRVLESVARANAGRLVPGPGTTNLFLYPPAHFRIVDALLTNFHLPRSTLLMLVSAFASPGDTTGRDLVLSAYQEAIALRFRFFSYGDAMWIA